MPAACAEVPTARVGGYPDTVIALGIQRLVPKAHGHVPHSLRRPSQTCSGLHLCQGEQLLVTTPKRYHARVGLANEPDVVPRRRRAETKRRRRRSGLRARSFRGLGPHCEQGEEAGGPHPFLPVSPGPNPIPADQLHLTCFRIEEPLPERHVEGVSQQYELADCEVLPDAGLESGDVLSRPRQPDLTDRASGVLLRERPRGPQSPKVLPDHFAHAWVSAPCLCVDTPLNLGPSPMAALPLGSLSLFSRPLGHRPARVPRRPGLECLLTGTSTVVVLPG